MSSAPSVPSINQPLDHRSRDVFRSIVETYLKTGDPVGSRTISRASGLGVSAATIRNVMADLEDIGLISAPHTSAGRIPTDIGLRLFVDGMMEIGNITKAERAAIKEKCEGQGRSIEDTLSEVSKTLSGLSQCASVVMVPKKDLMVRHIEFVPISARQALVVMVSEDGSVENRIIALPLGLPASALQQASNYLNARLGGYTLAQSIDAITAELNAQQAELDVLTTRIVEAGLAVWSGSAGVPASLIVSGQGHLLDDLDASSDLIRIKRLFDELERGNELVKLLGLAQGGDGVKMFIGAENNLFSLSGSSLVVSPYMNGANNIVGVVGVIGPTRLNYARIIPMVNYTAEAVTRLLKD